MRGLFLSIVCGFALVGCGGPSTSRTSEAPSGIAIDLDRANQERLLQYYFGTYAPEQPQDPFESGLLARDGEQFVVYTDSLAMAHPEAATVLKKVGQDGLIDWDDLVAFVSETYYAAAEALPTLEALQAAASYRDNPDDWFRVEVDGVMSVARRTIYIPYAALRSALQNYAANNNHLLYPVGTYIIGEHHLGGVQVETTVMRKRVDGFWDYFTYDQAGQLAATTETEPRQLKTPTQCVGCHVGTRAFEPERSFPNPARPGPHGPRAIYVADDLRDAEVTAFFDEHRKRSDTVLGLYNTLFVAQLRADRAAGTISSDDAALLTTLGL